MPRIPYLYSYISPPLSPPPKKKEMLKSLPDQNRKQRFFKEGGGEEREWGSLSFRLTEQKETDDGFYGSERTKNCCRGRTWY